MKVDQSIREKKNKTKTQSPKRRTHKHTTHTCTHIQIKHESSHLITR